MSAPAGYPGEVRVLPRQVPDAARPRGPPLLFLLVRSACLGPERAICPAGAFLLQREQARQLSNRILRCGTRTISGPRTNTCSLRWTACGASRFKAAALWSHSNARRAQVFAKRRAGRNEETAALYKRKVADACAVSREPKPQRCAAFCNEKLVSYR